MTPTSAPPIAKRVAYQRKLHGEQWTDYYHWLRADNWQECIDEPGALPDDIKAYLLAENEWFSQCMADTETLQCRLISEMRGRILDVDQSLPDAIGPWCYVERYEEGDEHPRYLRYLRSEQVNTADMQCLIDFNALAAGHEYFEPGDYDHSPDHRYVAWSADTQGSERYQLRIREVSTGIDQDLINDTYSMAWANERVLFYTRVDDDLRPSQVYRHEVGTPASDDVLVFEETDKRFFCSVWLSASEQYVFISSDMNDESEVWYIPIADVSRKPAVIQPREAGIEYSVEHQAERFLILTNADKALDFKIVTAPCDAPQRHNWQDWLAYRAGIMVLDIYVCEHWVMWLEREDALPRIRYCKASAPAESAAVITFEQEAYALSLEPLAEYATDSFRFSYQSPSTPEQIYAFDMTSGKRTLLKEDIVPSGHDSDDYIVERLYAPAFDNEQIPLTLLYKKGLALDGTAPCLLSAYGAYGSSIPAIFDSHVLSLVERGFVTVIAHVRGGQEKGRAWYDAARGVHKQNTFNDVVAAARYLIEIGYTEKRKIVLSGGSAGGLMVGAVINQYPDLWAGAIADVPFVDALNSLTDDSLPLTPGEWSQWGNPLESHELFDVVRAYSPYDNVEDHPYPPMLVTAGVSDPRVTYWEPAKWVAQHRHVRSDNNLLMLRTNMSSGHFGVSGRYASLEDEAISLAFALKVVGLS